MATSDYDNTVNYKATDSDNAYKAYPMIRGAILHSDRGTSIPASYIVKLSTNMVFSKA